MNKAYKVVYNESTGTYVAIAEIEKSRGKTSVSHVDGVKRTAAVWGHQTRLTKISMGLFGLFVSLVMPMAQASWVGGTVSDQSGTGNTGAYGYANPSYGIALGAGTAATEKAYAGGLGSTAIGVNARANAEGASAYGRRANAFGTSSVAVGDGSLAVASNSTAVGTNTQALTANSVAIGSLARVSSSDLTDQSLGNGGIAIGYNANAIGHADQGRGNGVGSAIAIGAQSQAYGNATMAIGTGAKAGNPSLGMPSSTGAERNSDSLAIGTGTNAFGNQSTAIGNNTTAAGNATIAIGADDIRTISPGSTLNYLAITGSALNTTGWSPTLAQGDGSVVIGVRATSAGDLSTAIGLKANSAGHLSAAIGANSNSLGNGSTAIGPNSQSAGTGSTAIGLNSHTVADYGTAIGSGGSNFPQRLKLVVSAQLPLVATKSQVPMLLLIMPWQLVVNLSPKVPILLPSAWQPHPVQPMLLQLVIKVPSALPMPWHWVIILPLEQVWIIPLVWVTDQLFNKQTAPMPFHIP